MNTKIMNTERKWAVLRRKSQQSLNKTMLSKAMGEIAPQELQDHVNREYTKLLIENDLGNGMLAKHLKQSILPAIAVYRILLSAGWQKENAFQLIRQSVLDASKPMARVFHAAGRLPFFFSLFRIMCPASIKSGFGEAGWRMEWKRNDRNAIEWDCHSCFYADVLNRYRMPELVSIFCESDDVVYGNIPGVQWGRTKTIGGGSNICDFRFYNRRGK
jgi:hypothetical protein